MTNERCLVRFFKSMDERVFFQKETFVIPTVHSEVYLNSENFFVVSKTYSYADDDSSVMVDILIESADEN